MNDKTSKVLKYMFWAILAVVLLYFSFRGVKWKDFFDVLGQCKWFWVFAAMAAGVFSFIFRALRWRLLLLPEEPSTKRINCYDGFTIGKLSDFVIPHVGEFVRCGYVRTDKLTYDKALGTVVLERIWDILMLLLLIILLLVFKWEEFGTFFLNRILVPVSERLDISLWLMLVIVAFVTAGIVAAVFALRSKSKFLSKAADALNGVWKGVGTCLKMRRKALFLLLTLLLWTMFLMMSLLVIKALPVDYGLTAVDALFIMLVGSVAGIVPVPGGFGAFHYLVTLALQTVYGIPYEMGIVFATMSHEFQAVTMILCGSVSYIHQALTRSSR